MCIAVLPSHQLPHQSKSKGGIAIVQVLPADANKGELCCRLAQLYCIVTILQLGANNEDKNKYQLISVLISFKCVQRVTRRGLKQSFENGSPFSCWFQSWDMVAC